MERDEPLNRSKGDRLKQLRAFCYTAVAGTMTAATERAMLSQPSVSNQIRALERELGAKLLTRRGPQISLTEAGDALYRYAMPLVQAMDRLPDTFAEDRLGASPDPLTIGAGQTSARHLLPRCLKRFRDRHPETRVHVRTGSGADRLRWLDTFGLDLVLLAMDKPPEDLVFIELAVSRFMLIAPKDHPLAGRPELRFSDLDGQSFVGHTPERHVRQVGDPLVRRLGVEPKYVLEVDGWNEIKLGVASGLGLAIVPELCLTERDPVWSTPLDEYLAPRRYGAATRTDAPLSLAAREFLASLAPDATRALRPCEPGAG